MSVRVETFFQEGRGTGDRRKLTLRRVCSAAAEREALASPLSRGSESRRAESLATAPAGGTWGPLCLLLSLWSPSMCSSGCG